MGAIPSDTDDSSFSSFVVKKYVFLRECLSFSFPSNSLLETRGLEKWGGGLWKSKELKFSKSRYLDANSPNNDDFGTSKRLKLKFFFLKIILQKKKWIKTNVLLILPLFIPSNFLKVFFIWSLRFKFKGISHMNWDDFFKMKGLMPPYSVLQTLKRKWCGKHTNAAFLYNKKRIPQQILVKVGSYLRCFCFK